MDDEDLVARLRTVAGDVDPVPVHVELAAYAALATRRLDAELAELTHDSWEAAALVRSAEGVRALTFEVGPVSLDVQVDGGLRVLVTGASGDLVIEQQTGERTVPIGPDGWVSVADPPRGPVRLRVTDDHGQVVVTRWFTA